VCSSDLFGPVAPAARLLFGVRRRRQIGGPRSVLRFAADDTTLDGTVPRRMGPARVEPPGPFVETGEAGDPPA
jgi:hypothetical protein